MMQDTVLGVAPLAVELVAAVGRLVETRPPPDQVIDQLGRTAHDLLHGLRVALARAADERVADMLLERVGRVGHRADAALCVVRIALVDLTFGHERHMTVSSRLERETEPCGPRPDNQEIGFHN